ncbi:MAG TPA: NIPSNAP family protein [Verrucomicrobiales bacterium]|nr:NIPSNAP family protein [Verrucomicrobiales bacterium]
MQPDTACYELRIYHIAPGKEQDLFNRFRNHTLKLFVRHDITSIGYWMPINAADQRLHFLLRYPSREAREDSWKAFVADPDWQAAFKASEANGALVQKVENPFLILTNYSPAVRTGDVSHGGVWEWRNYTTEPGRLPNLDARFRDHTIQLFAKYGMNNYAYWHLMPDQPMAEVTLDYFLTHASVAAAQASFDAFRKDPTWIAVKAASEQAAGGSLTIPDGVKSLFLKPTDFSPTT